MLLTHISAPFGSEAGGQRFVARQQPRIGPLVTQIVRAGHYIRVSSESIYMEWMILTHIPAAAQKGVAAGQLIHIPLTQAPPPVSGEH